MISIWKRPFGHRRNASVVFRYYVRSYKGTHESHGTLKPNILQPFRFSDHIFFVSTIPGLEPILERELKSLNVKMMDDVMDAKGGFHVQLESLKQLYDCHLHLGSCSHIYLRAGNEFIARGMDELVRKVSQLQIWRQLFSVRDENTSTTTTTTTSTPVNPVFKIKVSTMESKLFHTTGIAQRVTKGIYKSLGYHGLEDKEQVQNDHDIAIPIMVRIRKDKVQISIDSSQTPMHRRGYRLETGKAPLREDIAYALMYSLGWKEKSVHEADVMIVDPMCGSGTILIEAASMFFNLPPGRFRNAPMINTVVCDLDLWKEMVVSSIKNGEQKIEDYIEKHPSVPLAVGSDRDEGVVKAAKANISRANLSKVISVEHCAISSSSVWNSCQRKIIYLVTNPPYGLRVSKSKSEKKVHELLPLYQTIGKIVTSRENIKVGMIVHDIILARKSGVKNLKTIFTTQHGGLSVSFVASCGDG